MGDRGSGLLLEAIVGMEKGLCEIGRNWGGSGLVRVCGELDIVVHVRRSLK